MHDCMEPPRPINESDEDMCKHRSRPIVVMQFPSCLVGFRLTPLPPLSACNDSLTHFANAERGWRSKEARGGSAAPCLLREPPLPRQILIIHVMGATIEGPSARLHSLALPKDIGTMCAPAALAHVCLPIGHRDGVRHCAGSTQARCE